MREIIKKFVEEVLKDEQTKKDPEMIRAISELVKYLG